MKVIEKSTGKIKTAIYDASRSKMNIEGVYYADSKLSNLFIHVTLISQPDLIEWEKENASNIWGWEKDFELNCITFIFTDKTKRVFSIS